MKQQLSLLFFAALSGYRFIGRAAAGDPKFVACYESDGMGSYTNSSYDEFQSRGACQVTCVADVTKTGADAYGAMAMTKGTQCWCSQVLPNSQYKVDDDKCSEVCGGYKAESCGNRLGKYFSVYTTGEEDVVDLDEDDPASSSSASSTKTSSSDSSSSTSTSATQIADATSAAATTDKSSGGASAGQKAGIAAGCVVAVLAIIGISVGAWIFMRKRRRARVEEQYRRSAAAADFGKKPESDHRLDPGMIQRRDSVGSIDDNQDYSRRILKVTNPDGN